MTSTGFALRAALLLLLAAPAARAQLDVVSVTPPPHAGNVAPRGSFAIQLDRAVDPASLSAPNACALAGSFTGAVPASWTLESGGLVLRCTPLRAFAAGETAHLALRRGLAGVDGSHLVRPGWVARFRVAAEPASMGFTLVQDEDVRDQPGVLVRIYGANLCDLDGDLAIDLPVICENSGDVRVLLNRRDGTGRMEPWSAPPFPLLATPSPNESCDLDGDGHTDLVVANVGGNALSVAYGNGDGTFRSRTDLPVGLAPRGLAVLDVDGDGDLDLVTANVLSDDLSLVRNLGGGVFAPAASFEGGGSGEEALAAGDLDEDGILDLVVGARISQRVLVLHGQGNGAFTTVSSTYCGGLAWQITLGDLNGDRHLDVTVANSTSNTAGVLFGNGAGGLSAAQVFPLPAFVTASDLGDLDGDGDLDWVLSCHAGGIWRLFANDGLGGFSFVRDFVAASNPACAALADLDGDRDLDLVLLDELADRVQILRNGAEPVTRACVGDGVDADCPCGNSGAHGRGCAHATSSAGAVLASTGSVANDTLQLYAGGLPTNGLALFLAGEALEPPVPFGDGLLCASGFLRRFGRQSAQGGLASFPQPGTQTLGQASAASPGSGALRVYQTYFRSAAPFCTSATFNATNALVVLW
ncbi:MAG: VCBS repeat-containing protein [Planctomycetes bacterium]|nr:VCBS repeat-containing protein [Planctomycetota bacterium]